MDELDPLRFVLSFAFVISLIGLFAYALKRYSRTAAGRALLGQSAPGGGRVQVLEARYIDGRRKLLLVRRDTKEHLLLLSDKGEMLVESWDVRSDER